MSWDAELRDAMAGCGLLSPGEVVADGKVHRFPVEGDKAGNRNGWYVAHADMPPSAAFGSWKTGERHAWSFRRFHDCVELRQRRNAGPRGPERHVDREAMHRAAADEAARVFLSAHAPHRGHPYLLGKAVGAYGIRQLRGALLVPLRDASGKLHSLQRIYPDGNKRFLKGGRVQGCFHTIGAPTSRVWVCEGYATGASIHEDTGDRVLVALSAGNLLAVGRAALGSLHVAELCVMADDDWQTDENPGITKASEVAECLGVTCFRPTFPENRPSWATDYNDAVRLRATDGRAIA